MPYGIFRHVILPLSRPALVTTAIFSFIWTWNDFFRQLVYLSDLRDYTVPVALTLFIDSTSQSAVGPMFAMSRAVAAAGVPVLRRVPADAGRGHQHQRTQGLNRRLPLTDQATTIRHDWRDTLRNATDLALLGLIGTVAALPVVTAGAAVATASAALHHWIEHDSWPGSRPVLRGFLRAVPAGAGATAIAALAATLLGGNLLVLHRGLVPGGPALIVVTAILTVAAGGLAGMTVVQVGRQGGRGWRTAARLAGRTALRRPAAPLASAGVLALASTLGLLVLPLLTPVLAGYALFALHAVTRRTAIPR